MSLQQRAPPCSCAIWNVVWMFSWSSLQLVPSCISVLFMWCNDNNSGEWTEPWVENLVHRCPFCVPKCFFPEPTKIMGLIFKLNFFFFLMTKIVQFHLCLFLPLKCIYFCDWQSATTSLFCNAFCSSFSRTFTRTVVWFLLSFDFGRYAA